MIRLAALLLLAQESPEAALSKKCDSQIPWITDGTELEDGSKDFPKEPVDRLALLERAKKEAGERKRPILWYCMRVPGTHTYRAAVLDGYARVALFTDPALVELVKAQYVPLRMACDERVSAATGVKFPEFIEPGFVVMTPEGKVVRTLDRLRTFNAARIRVALGGPPGAPSQPGVELLARRDFEGARKLFEKDESPEALYHLSAVEWWTGKDPEGTWRKLIGKHPESPWAWRAAANLVKGRDGLRQGPMTHNFEDFFAPSDGGPERRAVEFLLRAQREDGTWSDSRYSYGWAAYMIRRRVSEGLLDPGYRSWPDTGLHPNVFVAVTALAATALLEWRDLAPERVDAALARAEKFLRDDDNLSPAHCEACYADTYRLLYFATKRDVPRMNRMVSRLYELQDREGFWSHEYPSAFATAAVVRCLILARRAGAEVPEPMLQRAADALLKTRGQGGLQDYRHEPGKPHSSEKDSMGRTASSELALFECGKSSIENVAAGVESYWRHLGRLEAVRTCDNHADGELAGFFYFNSVFHTLEAARALPEPARAEQLRKFRAQVLSIPEPDGSFVDSHELGKSYGTAMALLILRRTGGTR